MSSRVLIIVDDRVTSYWLKDMVTDLMNEGFTVKGIDFSAELDMMHAEKEQGVVIAIASNKKQVECAKTVFKATNARVLILFIAERVRDVNFSKLSMTLLMLL